MVQLNDWMGKGTCCQVWWPEFNLWNSHDKTKESTTSSWPKMSTLLPYYTHPHRDKNKTNFKNLKWGCVQRNCQKQIILWVQENIVKANISKYSTRSLRVKSCNQMNFRRYRLFLPSYLPSFLMIHYHWWTRKNFPKYTFLSRWNNYMYMTIK